MTQWNFYLDSSADKSSPNGIEYKRKEFNANKRKNKIGLESQLDTLSGETRAEGGRVTELLTAAHDIKLKNIMRN